MQYLGRAKIGKLHPKRSKVYPMVRLPEQCLDVVGEIVRIYTVEMEGVSGFFIALETRADEEREVAQPQLKVAQQSPQNDVRSRLLELESEIEQLKSLLLLNERNSPPKNRKQKAEGEIRTRVVASTGP